MAKISIFGLGYVGCVSAACFADEGNTIIGIDVNPVKVDLINSGKSPIVEPGLDEKIKSQVKAGKLTAAQNSKDAVLNTDISLVCVGTPSDPHGGILLKYLEHVAGEIGEALKEKNSYHVIAFRSTMVPGTAENILVPLLEKSSGKKVGKDFGVCVNPEFLRESTAISDFYNPPKTLIGEFDTQSGDVIASLYANIKAPIVRTKIEIAEMIKYANNIFHGVKVCFANEIGNLCKELEIDSHKVMEIFCMDTQLNLSPYYLKPGFAFGGSCLTKDLRAMLNVAHKEFLEIPLLESVIQSNEHQIIRAYELIKNIGKKNVGILGLSFKADTDDLRESPMVILSERLIGRGYSLKIYDKNVSLSKLLGANKEFIEREIPHISSLMYKDIDEVINSSDIIVVGNKSPEFKTALLSITDKNKIVIDLVRIIDEQEEIRCTYEGICW